MRRPFLIRSSLTFLSVAAGISLAACTSTENSNSNIEGTLAAAGASFPAAIYQRWFSDLAPQGIQVNYQSVGSGAGVRQFTAGTVDFGASDRAVILGINFPTPKSYPIHPLGALSKQKMSKQKTWRLSTPGTLRVTTLRFPRV